MREKDLRTAILIGEAGIQALRSTSIAIVGLGGVGGYTAEAIARAGAKKLIIVDFDRVQESNINRQIIAMSTNIGRQKTDLIRERIHLIDPEIEVIARDVFASCENYAEVLGDAEFLVDAIDSIEAKIGLLEYAYHQGLGVVSVFGAGNRLDPSFIRTGDISQSSGCPLAKRVRKALREKGIVSGIRSVYSLEQPIAPKFISEETKQQPGKARTIGSIAYMPGIMGLTAASEIIRMILVKAGLSD